MCGGACARSCRLRLGTPGSCCVLTPGRTRPRGGQVVGVARGTSRSAAGGGALPLDVPSRRTASAGAGRAWTADAGRSARPPSSRTRPGFARRRQAGPRLGAQGAGRAGAVVRGGTRRLRTRSRFSSGDGRAGTPVPPSRAGTGGAGAAGRPHGWTVSGAPTPRACARGECGRVGDGRGPRAVWWRHQSSRPAAGGLACRALAVRPRCPAPGRSGHPGRLRQFPLKRLSGCRGRTRPASRSPPGGPATVRSASGDPQGGAQRRLSRRPSWSAARAGPLPAGGSVRNSAERAVPRESPARAARAGRSASGPPGSTRPPGRGARRSRPDVARTGRTPPAPARAGPSPRLRLARAPAPLAHGPAEARRSGNRPTQRRPPP